MTLWHKNLESRFSGLPTHQQIIMVTNELNRANHQQNNTSEYKASLERALELLDFIIDDKAKWDQKYRELLRARQYLALLYINAETYTETTLLQRTLIQMDPVAASMLKV